jgi:hypothetical protein
LQKKLDEVRREKMLLEQQIEREHQSNSDLKSSLASIRGTEEDSIPESGEEPVRVQIEREDSIPEGDEEQE